MMIYKNDGKKGFAVSSNLISSEKLGTMGLTAAIFAVILLITKGGDGKKSKKSAASKKDKKQTKIKKLLRVAIIPSIMKIAKFSVSQGKLQSLIKKVKNGEDITNGLNFTFNGEPVDLKVTQEEPSEPKTVCGMEIIEPINIGGEEEIYEHL